MDPKKNSVLTNATIVAAIITFCGTLTAAILGSPALAELYRENQAAQTAAARTPGIGEPTGPAGPATNAALPDLIAVDISSPLCQTQRQAGPDIKYVRHIFTIRNIGPGSTAPFGTFSSRVVIIVEGQRYTLDQWSEMFNGLMDIPDLNIPSLGPNDDAFLTLNIHLRGNNNYSLEVIANSGASVIPESNTTNNNLTQKFTSNCR